MRKTLLLLTTMTLALLLAAGVALAQGGPAQQTTIHFPPSEFGIGYPEDPCNPGEGEVTITGTATGFITEVVTPNGAYMYTVHLQQKGTGVSSEGSQYSFNQRTTDRFRSEDPAGDATVFTSTLSLMLNNLGGGDNEVIRMLFHVTDPLGDPVVEFGDVVSECRG